MWVLVSWSGNSECGPHSLACADGKILEGGQDVAKDLLHS